MSRWMGLIDMHVSVVLRHAGVGENDGGRVRSWREDAARWRGEKLLPLGVLSQAIQSFASEHIIFIEVSSAVVTADQVLDHPDNYLFHAALPDMSYMKSFASAVHTARSDERSESEPWATAQLERSYPWGALLSNRGRSLNNNLRKERDNRGLEG